MRKIIYTILLCLFSNFSYASFPQKDFKELLDYASKAPQVDLSSYTWKDFDKEQTQAILKALGDNSQIWDLSLDDSTLDVLIVPEIDFLLQKSNLFPSINIYSSGISLRNDNYPLNPYIECYVSDQYFDRFVRGIKNIPLSLHRDELHINWFKPDKQSKETTVKSCELLNQYLTDNPLLKSLVLSGIRDIHLQELSKGVFLNPSLRSLSFNNDVYFYKEGYPFLIKALQKTNTLKHLSLGGQTVPSYTLSDIFSLPLQSLNSWCSLSASKDRALLCEIISEKISLQKTLVSLNISSNHLSLEDVNILLGGFEKNTILKKLDLSNNYVSSSAFHSLFEKNTTLTHLFISSFTEDSIPYLEKNRTLQFLRAPHYVRYNPLPSQQEFIALKLLPKAREIFLPKDSPIRKLYKNITVDILRFLVTPSFSSLDPYSPQEWQDNVISIPDLKVLSIPQLNFIREFSEDRKTLGLSKDIFLSKLFQEDDRKVSYNYVKKNLYECIPYDDSDRSYSYANDGIVILSTVQYN
jgi:hypothetical protein